MIGVAENAEAVTRTEPRFHGGKWMLAPMNPLRVLHLTLNRYRFDRIATGQETIEYRRSTGYWRRRLAGRCYDEVWFRNGYNPGAPFMRVACGRIVRRTKIAGSGRLWHIRLGPVLDILNWPGPDPKAEARLP